MNSDSVKKKTFIKSVLLADDDRDDRDLFKEAAFLVDPTVNVIFKKNGEELMEFLLNTDSKPDVIFLDLNMPRKNGKECLDEIRNNKSLVNIPVIIYSTSLNPTDIDISYSYNALFFVQKPNSFQVLKNLLSTIFSKELQAFTTQSKENFVLNNNLKAD